MTSQRWHALGCVLVALLGSPAVAQETGSSRTYLDPAHDPASLQPAPPTSLREQFIWTKGDAAALNPQLQAKVRGQDDKTVPHYFRKRFFVDVVPARATLYIAGPRMATVVLNGKEILRFDDSEVNGKGFHVTTADATATLRPGNNLLAIEEVRGHSSLHTGASPTINQVTYGEVLAVKIVPRGIAEDAPPIVISDESWRSTLQPGPDWASQSFDDSSWATVQTLGSLGSKSDFLQWNADAGLYAWPGYSGISPAMRTFRIAPVSVREEGGRTTPATGKMTFAPTEAGAPSAVVLDFGKEISGRIHLVSSSNQVVTVGTSYGESAEETNGHPYLGVRMVTVPAHGEAYGPKSAFRYVRLTFPPDIPSTWSRIDAQGIAYPVDYKGSFESSDPLINHIWETGAYTAHLCMQEGIWDGVKRDRGRWMGDLDVTGRVISSVFADRTLMEPTMAAVIGEPPVQRDVNTIAGYSALWVTGQANFYRHSGDLDYLRSQHQALLDLLGVMKAELDADALFTNPEKHKVFVDWSSGFSSDTSEARAATHFEFYLAFQEAAFLLTEMGDKQNAEASRAMADRLGSSAQNHLLDHATNTFGGRWQTNAMAVFSGAATAPEKQAIWSEVLSHVSSPVGADTVVTPYYGYYVLSAMGQVGHKCEALDWMREYWGGMLDEGATSFWEAYDPRWPKQDFHAHLEADGKTGYYVSLAHGWASGPTAWLMEQVLGIEPTAAGFREVSIHPDLAGLKWARGAEPTPHGLIRVSIEPRVVHVTMPQGIAATVSLPFTGTILENRKPVATATSDDDKRSIIKLNRAGDYTFTVKEDSGQRNATHQGL